MLDVVVNEVLQQELIHRGTAAGTGNRPDVVGQRADDPVPWSSQGDDTGTHADLSLT